MTQKNIQEVKRLDYLKREVRLDIIRQDLLDGKTHEEIARELSFSRSTLERDLRHWRASGGFSTPIVKQCDEILAMMPGGS